jgi:hypothetical protein
MKGISRFFGAVLICLTLVPATGWAECSTIAEPIDTDRPDSPDDSPTVPPGSLQMENGLGISRSGGVKSLELPSTRLRYGLSSCTELLIDLPNYNHALGHGPRGFGDIAPGFKHQFDDLLPEPYQLWLAGGVALPTGDQTIAGRGAQPYIQVPASVDLTEKLTLAAQYLVTFHPGDVETAPEHQVSFDLELDLNEDLGLFAEYTGTYRHGAQPANTADLGFTYRLTPVRQVDLLIGKGLNTAAPDWYFSIGYSFRLDGLL